MVTEPPKIPPLPLFKPKKLPPSINTSPAYAKSLSKREKSKSSTAPPRIKTFPLVAASLEVGSSAVPAPITTSPGVPLRFESPL